jgi:hypothetical protein
MNWRFAMRPDDWHGEMAGASLPSTAFARTHHVFTIDVQRDAGTGEIVGALLTDAATGDTTAAAIDGPDIMNFIHDRLRRVTANMSSATISSAMFPPPSPTEILCTHTVAEAIVDAPYGFSVAVELPAGTGEARVWISARSLSGVSPATPSGSATCALNETESVTAYVNCDPLPASSGPYALEMVAEMKVSSLLDVDRADSTASASILPEPRVATAPFDPVRSMIDYWRHRSLAATK